MKQPQPTVVRFDIESPPETYEQQYAMNERERRARPFNRSENHRKVHSNHQGVIRNTQVHGFKLEKALSLFKEDRTNPYRTDKIRRSGSPKSRNARARLENLAYLNLELKQLASIPVDPLIADENRQQQPEVLVALVLSSSSDEKPQPAVVRFDIESPSELYEQQYAMNERERRARPFHPKLKPQKSSFKSPGSNPQHTSTWLQIGKSTFLVQRRPDKPLTN